jgi:hypothetical protein
VPQPRGLDGASAGCSTSTRTWALVLRVGYQGIQDAIWARRATDHRWRDEADAAGELLREGALAEALDILGGAFTTCDE